MQEAVRNAEDYCSKNFGGVKLKKKASAPWPQNYESELDTSPELGPDLASYYQSQVGVLHWVAELGRVDVVAEASKLASHMALPREGHLETLFYVFAYLKNKHNSRLVFDPTCPDVDTSVFPQHD